MLFLIAFQHVKFSAHSWQEVSVAHSTSSHSLVASADAVTAITVTLSEHHSSTLMQL